MTTSTEVKASIDNLTVSLDNVVSEGIAWIEETKDMSDFIAALNTETTGLLDRMKDVKVKMNDWRTDSTFKNMNVNMKVDISQFGWSVIDRLSFLTSGAEEFEDLLGELDSNQQFADLAPLLQRTIQKIAWPFFNRVRTNLWRLEKLKNLIDRGA